jgi:hypothetical protein
MSNDIRELRAEVEQLRAELLQFRPEPMSQQCRDGHHNRIGEWKCIGCHCLCHNRDAEVEELQRSRDGWQADAGTYLDNANFWRKRAHTDEAERDRLAEQVKRVRDIHVPHDCRDPRCAVLGQCEQCMVPSPCATLTVALDGTEAGR